MKRDKINKGFVTEHVQTSDKHGCGVVFRHTFETSGDIRLKSRPNRGEIARAVWFGARKVEFYQKPLVQMGFIENIPKSITKKATKR